MKLTLPSRVRRPDPVVPEDAERPPLPRPPHGAPVAACACLTDGRTLWLAVHAESGRLALRDTATGEVLALVSDLPEDQPAYRSVRTDLTALPWADTTSYDVVLLPSPGRPPRPVWSPPLRTAGPAPAAPDGRSRFAVERTGDGWLRVVRRDLPSAVELLGVRAVREGLEITLAGEPATLALLHGAEPLVTVPVSREGGRAAACLVAEALPNGPERMTRVVVGEPGAWLPVRRRDHDLADPGRAVPMPLLYSDGGDGVGSDEVRLRLRWSGDGLLLARLQAVGAAAGGTGTGTGEDTAPDPAEGTGS